MCSLKYIQYFKCYGVVTRFGKILDSRGWAHRFGLQNPIYFKKKFNPKSSSFNSNTHNLVNFVLQQHLQFGLILLHIKSGYKLI